MLTLNVFVPRTAGTFIPGGIKARGTWSTRIILERNSDLRPAHANTRLQRSTILEAIDKQTPKSQFLKNTETRRAEQFEQQHACRTECREQAVLSRRGIPFEPSLRSISTPLKHIVRHPGAHVFQQRGHVDVMSERFRRTRKEIKLTRQRMDDDEAAVRFLYNAGYHINETICSLSSPHCKHIDALDLLQDLDSCLQETLPYFHLLHRQLNRPAPKFNGFEDEIGWDWNSLRNIDARLYDLREQCCGSDSADLEIFRRHLADFATQVGFKLQCYRVEWDADVIDASEVPDVEDHEQALVAALERFRISEVDMGDTEPSSDAEELESNAPSLALSNASTSSTEGFGQSTWSSHSSFEGSTASPNSGFGSTSTVASSLSHSDAPSSPTLPPDCSQAHTSALPIIVQSSSPNESTESSSIFGSTSRALEGSRSNSGQAPPASSTKARKQTTQIAGPTGVTKKPPTMPSIGARMFALRDKIAARALQSSAASVNKAVSEA